MSQEKTHYTREELEEFRVIILEKLKEAREENKNSQNSLRNSAETAGETYNKNEYGAEMQDKEHTEMLMMRNLKFIDALERALIRIENGSYGRCRVSGQLIPKERLRLVPHTETSIEAKLGKI